MLTWPLTAQLSREPSQPDKELVRAVFYKIPLMERGTPIQQELLWVLLGRQNSEQHIKLLPEYCYNIFDVFLKTYFKGFPLLSETVQITDSAGLPGAKSIEAAKEVLRINWKNVGRLFGIMARCIRFAEMEAAEELEKDGFSGSSPEEIVSLFTMIFGRDWVLTNRTRIEKENPDKIFVEYLQEHTTSALSRIPSMVPIETVAYEWSPEASADFHAGYAEGMSIFVDFNRQLAGESGRSGIYTLLLLAWPEIKSMLEASPRKTLSDLHEWMMPFMRVGRCKHRAVMAALSMSSL